jgi:ubiquinone/menaquinone biosynthesis C-methylase UbiE
MSSLRRRIVGQFRRPSGPLGQVAGWIMTGRESNRRRNEWTVELVAPRDGETLLEIGSGPGYALARAAARAGRLDLTGLDHSATMVVQARRRLQREAPAGAWRLVEGGMERLDGWPERFDAIWSVNVVQFLPDLPRAFASIAAALAPGGRVVTTYQPRHRAPTREDALRKAGEIAAAMRAAGFEGIRSEMLELKPVPAVAVAGRKPMAAD